MIPSAPAADWPQWRGPNRDNVSAEVGLLKEWPEGGPPLVWRVEGIGTGIASIAVREGTIYALGYIGDHEYLTALGEKTGRRRWTTRVGPAVREHPYMRHRCERMPTVDKEFVYALNGHGQLCCLRTDNGGEIWRKDYGKDFGVERRTWGILDYPLVDGDRLICLPGGPMWAMVALDKITGEVIWKCQTAGTDYSSLVVAELGGVRQYVACVAEGVIGVSAKDGEILWKYSKLANRYHNFTPIVRDDFVVCPSPRRGTVAGLKVTSRDGVFSVEAQYSQRISLDTFQDGVT
jgi:outer membrane protein assembly factor BamB